MSSTIRLFKDKWVRILMIVLTLGSVFALFIVGFGLLYKSIPILKDHNILDLLFGSQWAPLKGKFGFWPFIISTLWVTGVAILIAIPFSILCAIYLSEYAPKSTIRIVNPLIDILAGIPSVIFGVWGIIVVVPFVRDVVGPFFGHETTGFSILSGGIVLSIMIFPVIIHILLEVFNTVHPDLKNASLALGATKWITIRKVMLRQAAPGIISAIALGLSRAFGETLAVLLVVGNTIKMPKSSLDGAYPLTALIANNYGETFSIPMYDSALMLASLILFVIVLIFNIISRIILRKVEKSIS